jgi:hypothetical protein
MNKGRSIDPSPDDSSRAAVADSRESKGEFAGPIGALVQSSATPDTGERLWLTLPSGFGRLYTRAARIYSQDNDLACPSGGLCDFVRRQSPLASLLIPHDKFLGLGSRAARGTVRGRRYDRVLILALALSVILTAASCTPEEQPGGSAQPTESSDGGLY